MVDSSKIITTVEVDPNFPKPPNVIDIQYKNIDEDGNSTTRDGNTGDVVTVNYDETTYSNPYGDTDGTGSTFLLSAPDTITVVSQQTRVTTDGRTVVDVILDIADTQAGLTYDVRLTKP